MPSWRRGIADAPPIATREIRSPRWLVNLCLAVGPAFMALLLVAWAHEWGRPNSAVYWVLTPVYAVVLGLMFRYLPCPSIRIDESGLSGLGSRLVPWRDIKACHLFIQRGAWGKVDVTVNALGEGERRLATVGMREGSSDDKREFLLALYHALQSHTVEPDLSQVLQVFEQGP